MHSWQTIAMYWRLTDWLQIRGLLLTSTELGGSVKDVNSIVWFISETSMERLQLKHLVISTSKKGGGVVGTTTNYCGLFLTGVRPTTNYFAIFELASGQLLNNYVICYHKKLVYDILCYRVFTKFFCGLRKVFFSISFSSYF